MLYSQLSRLLWSNGPRSDQVQNLMSQNLDPGLSRVKYRRLYSVCTPLATVDSSNIMNKVHSHAPDAHAFFSYLLECSIDTKLLSVLSINPIMFTVLLGNDSSDSYSSVLLCGPEAILAVSSAVNSNS